MSSALFYFWERRGYFQEGRAWLERALAASPEAPAHARAQALNALASLSWRGDDAERAEPIAEQGLAASRAAGSVQDQAWALINVGMVAYARGQFAVAAGRLEACVAFARQVDQRVLLSLGLTFLCRALVALRGPLDRAAVASIEESLALARTAGSQTGVGYAVATLGDIAWQRGVRREAVENWQQALAIRRQLADRRGIADGLERLAWGLSASERYTAAAWLFGAADAQQVVLGVHPRPDEAADHAAQLANTRAHLDDEAFRAAWAAGFAASGSASLEDALAFR
jgi:non-specific serine/threonine protein kinase